MPRLNRLERIYWAPKLTVLDVNGQPVDPQPSSTDYEVSIDGGATWETSTDHPDLHEPCWVIRGPDADDPGIEITGRTKAIVRLKDSPEILVAIFTLDIDR